MTTEEIPEEEMNKWTSLGKTVYDDVNESDFERKGMTVQKVIDALKDENSMYGDRSLLKVVVNGQFYRVRDVYTIEDDDVPPYICIEGEKG